MKLDRRVQFWRAGREDDGFSQALAWAKHGPEQYATKTDVSDAERWRAGEVAATITTRFLVRLNSLTAGITAADRLECEGLTYDIQGLKEPPGTRGRWREITANARAD